jgi:hypothetical protein
LYKEAEPKCLDGLKVSLSQAAPWYYYLDGHGGPELVLIDDVISVDIDNFAVVIAFVICHKVL